MSNPTKQASDKKLTGNRCQCTACGEYFNRVSTFDRHRVGTFGLDRRCLTLDEMAAKGWHTNAAGFYVTSSGGWKHGNATGN
jgi:hypothetical protein